MRSPSPSAVFYVAAILITSVYAREGVAQPQKVLVSSVSGDITVTGSKKVKHVSSSNAITQNGSNVMVQGPASHDNISVTVPSNVKLHAMTTSGAIDIRGVLGPIRCITTSGDIRIHKAGKNQISIRSISGDISVDSMGGSLKVKTVSGDVEASARNKINITSVSGDITLDQKPASKSVVKTTSGQIRIKGALSKNGKMKIRSHSGNIQVDLKALAGAAFALRSYSGRLKVKRGKRGHLAEVNSIFRGIFGKGKANVKLTTFSGDVQLHIKH
jgi:DUF4097 and DUF4098 domain-containing protein YvlB